MAQVRPPRVGFSAEVAHSPLLPQERFKYCHLQDTDHCYVENLSIYSVTLIDNTVITIGNRLDSVNFLYLILNMLWKSACFEMCQNLLGYARESEVGNRVNECLPSLLN